MTQRARGALVHRGQVGAESRCPWRAERARSRALRAVRALLAWQRRVCARRACLTSGTSTSTCGAHLCNVLRCTKDTGRASQRIAAIVRSIRQPVHQTAVQRGPAAEIAAVRDATTVAAAHRSIYPEASRCGQRVKRRATQEVQRRTLGRAIVNEQRAVAEHDAASCHMHSTTCCACGVAFETRGGDSHHRARALDEKRATFVCLIANENSALHDERGVGCRGDGARSVGHEATLRHRGDAAVDTQRARSLHVAQRAVVHRQLTSLDNYSRDTDRVGASLEGQALQVYGEVGAQHKRCERCTRLAFRGQLPAWAARRGKTDHRAGLARQPELADDAGLVEKHVCRVHTGGEVEPHRGANVRV